MEIALEQFDAADWRKLYPFQSHFARIGRRANALHRRSGRSTQTLCFSFTATPRGRSTGGSLILALRKRYRCVAADHLGCGFSDKPATFLRLDQHIDNLVALVERLGLERVTLVAQDWGGAIGLGAMLRMPERLERIVLFNTGAFPPRYIPWQIQACRVPLVGRLAVQGANLFSRAALSMTLARQPRLDPASRLDTWRRMIRGPNRRAVYGFVRDIPANKHHPTWQTLAEIERGITDRCRQAHRARFGACAIGVSGPDCLERFVAAWPDAQVHRLADVGHWVVEDAPEDALPIVEKFLAGEPSMPRAKRRLKRRDDDERYSNSSLLRGAAATLACLYEATAPETG